uniref:DNA polymerase epsilon catalytic subunit n=1 Tax=Ditylenchus dipsaci TaxID=166011 RepID=A0A915CMU3_9BILA
MADDDLVSQDVFGKNSEQRLEIIRQRELIDAKFGYQRVNDTLQRTAWLVNVQSGEIFDELNKSISAATDFYFLDENGDRFKISYPVRPYLYVATSAGNECAVETYLTSKYHFIKVEHVEKEDLDLKNHLSGIRSKFLCISFPSTAEMSLFKKELMPQIRKNRDKLKNASEYTEMVSECFGGTRKVQDVDVNEHIVDIREYDLPYHMRVCIDKRLFVGLWYTVMGRDPCTLLPSIVRNTELVDPPDPVVCAYDIETTKLPLKFPDSEVDQIMMISYMIDGIGFLIINREIVSEDVEDFEYTPRPEFKGEFTVFNEKNEAAVIRKFFDHILRTRPSIIVTYNGDCFDWPFVEARANLHKIPMKEHIGFYKDSQDEYKHNNCIHMDAYRWVARDSYLPIGSQNLKATTKAKLRYDPLELEPELMLEMAKHQPKVLANYSVSDAVATYYLYMQYVHPFIFALCTIIPLGPDDVLRKGSGTLCEALLMVEAYHKNIIYPNKQIGEERKMTKDGHLLDSETYVGGHVEALESGVFRADIPCRFRLMPEALEDLKNKVRSTMQHTLTTEMSINMEDVVNFVEACEKVENQLEGLMVQNTLHEKPEIYHLDVGAMYPNIILTNRLQPPAVVTEETCLACVYNEKDAICKRKMDWQWRGELIPATRGEYDQLIQQLEQEKFGKPPRPFHALPRDERNKIEKKRIQVFLKHETLPKRLSMVITETRTTTICMRENAFYVDTVLAFRDRRYEYKAMLKNAKAAAASVPTDDLAGQKLAQSRVVLYESLQLAHKCILNSFYGYVMRRGSRWFSMEMAGIVCHTGANIIKEARILIDKIGRPLELDTDGIWCLLPSSFPSNITFNTKSGKSIVVSYPGAVLNELVKDKFTNDQYHTLDSEGKYNVSSENSIFFEVDGPYLAMILPAAKEEGKKLKKRYAVFNFDGTLAELKGFEVKRRGEALLSPKSMKMLLLKRIIGRNLPNEELFELIGENRSMSRKLEDYGSQKSTSITTAKRLSEFLGDDMVKNAGLACRFIVSNYPIDAPVTERTIPLAIFQAEPKITCHYLRKWTKNMNLSVDNIEVRELIDWTYYSERLGSTIQKIVTIPAALQGLPNPVPRVPHPKWLESRKKATVDLRAQPRITEMLKRQEKSAAENGPLRDPKTLTNNRKRTLQSENPLGEIDENCAVEIDDGLGIFSAHSHKRPCEKGIDVVGLTPGVVNDEGQQITSLDSVKNEFWMQPLRGKKFSRANKAVTFDSLNRTGDLGVTPEKKTLQRLMRRDARVSSQPAEQQDTSVLRSLSRRERLLNDSNWQIIQINETKFPGQFTVFAIVDSSLRTFNMTVERTFYVDDVRPRDTNIGKLVQKSLPKMRPSSYLYEYSVDEAHFAMRLNEFNAEMCSARINGIYETEVPLLFKAIVQLGCTCKPNSSKTTSISSNIFRRIDKTEANYVDRSLVRVFFFYEFSHGARSVMAFFSPSTLQGVIVIVNRSKVDVANLDNLYKIELQKFINRQGESDLDTRCREISVKLVQATTLRDGSQQLQNLLKSMKLSQNDPAIFCIQSSRNSSQLSKEFPWLNGFPQIRIRVLEPPSIINVLDWANVMTKRATQHFFNSFIQLRDYWFMAHHAGIPVGNIPDDIATTSLDIFYARQLQLRVCQPSTLGYCIFKPDFGGKEIDDLRLGNDWESTSFGKSFCIYNQETFETKNIVVSLSLGAVAVSALLHNSRIIEAEGISEAVSFTSGNMKMSIEDAMSHRLALTNYDEAAASSGSLKVLKEVFHELIRDIFYGKNELFADLLICNMHRWIRNPDSLLYNPAICSAVSILMRKLCLLLVAEINRLGGKVIHCSFTKIVLSTNRSKINMAKAFVDSLIVSLSQKSTFSSLNIHIHSFSTMFLWIDSTNYAFIKCSENESTEEIPVRLNFAMSEGLPKEGGCLESFSNITIGYLVLLHKKVLQAEMSDEEFEEYCNKILMDEIAPNLFELTMKLTQMRQELNTREELRLPNFRSSDIPLDFVKCICKVLSVNQLISKDVENLRTQLMRILQVDDASPISVWVPPPVSVVFEHVFCKKCNQAGELHICAKAEIISADNEPLPFNCSLCHANLQSDQIEEMLMERTSKMVLSFTLQDLKCSVCKRIGVNYLPSHCQDCNNKLERTISLEAFRMNIVVVRRVARRHSLKNLQYYVDEICKHNGL